jgi:hypothetical protein
MFLRDQTKIQAYASQSPDNTFKVLRFVQMTIQQTFYSLPSMTEEINNTGVCRRLSGRQSAAIEFYADNKQEIFDNIFGSLPLRDKLLFVASLPGFGLVKAGFVLQCCIGEIGCFDVHNCRTYGIKPSQFVLRDGSPSNVKKAQAYIELCASIGCSKLWDDWCILVADKYPQKFSDAGHVSRLHFDCVNA